MNETNSRFASLKSVTLVVLLAGFILASGFIAAKTLLFTEPTIESSGEPTVNASYGNPGNASSGEPNVEVSSGDPGVKGSSGNPRVQVWVNTKSGVYHCPNTRWYGNKKHGKYMTQQEAHSKGYRPAYGTVCG